MNRVGLVAVILVVGCLAFSIGAAWEASRFEDNQVYWFGQYSEHLRELVEQHRTSDLTNDIVAFDTKVRPRMNDREKLQEQMYQLLKLGPYFRPTSQTASNAPAP